MRPSALIVLVVLFVGLYTIDRFQHDGHYSEVVWKQANTKAQILQGDLKAWWRQH